MHDFTCKQDNNVSHANDSSSCDDLQQMLDLLETLSGSDNEYRTKILYYLMGIGGSVVCCLGTIANALSVAVLTRRSMRSSTYAYLTALAICDSLVLFLTFLIIINDTRPPDSPKQIEQFHALLFPFVHPTAVVFQVTSIWLTLAFTVDRYIMICHPFKAERMCRRSRARKVIIFLYIAGLLFNIPRYLEYRTKTETLPLANSTEVYTFYGIETTALGKSDLFLELVHSWLYLIFICGIPFFTLVILNAFLIRAVHLSRQKGKDLNPTEKHRNDTTIMLIGVIVIFLICQGPALVSRMVYALKPAATSTNAGFTLNEVGNFFVLLNSAINIVPYYLFGRKFRSEFWRLFCKCFFDKDELTRIVKSYSVSMDQRRMSQYNVMEMNGVFNSSQGFNAILNEQDNRKSPRTNTIYSFQRKRTPINGSRNFMRHSDTMDSVAAPLIHSTQNSLSSSELTRDTSNDSIKNISSLFHTPTATSPYSHNNSNGHNPCMTVTPGPCVNAPEWSTV